MKPDTNQDGNAEKDKRARIQEVQARTDISDAEKARLVQQIMTEGCQWQQEVDEDERDKIYQAGIAAFAPHKDDKEREDLRSSITCQVCLEYVKRPISLACQHSLCLECLRGVRRMDTAQRNCPSCRAPIASSMFESARVNQAMVAFMRRLADLGRPSRAGKVVAARAHTDEVEDRPEEAFVTERAKRAGMANACSGALRMTCGPNHFGPIGPEFDPKRSRGVVVGDLYSNRMTCRMECAHLPHVAGIAGRGEVGAQSVVLSGGYVDDVDEGDWFLYTGSGGKDLSGNKRNGDHNGDQTFDRMNLAIKKSCVEGYPVRVVRSCKEKRSAYAPSKDALKQLQELMDGGDEAAAVAAAGGKGAGGGGSKKKKTGGKTGGNKKGKGKSEEEEEGEEEAEEESGEEEQASEEDQDSEEEEEEAEEKKKAEKKKAEKKKKGGKKGGRRKKAADEGQEEEEGEDADGEGAEEGKPEAEAGCIKTAKPKTLLPVRYDGCYRVLACWRVKGIEGFLVCRYLFVRCDNSPAPWSSDDTGDRPRMEIPERAQQEMDAARELSEEVTFMGGNPAWGFNAATGQWGWTRDPPHSSGGGAKGGGEARKKAGGAKPLTKQLEAAQRELKKLLKQLTDSYSCQVCTRVMSSEQRRPVQTPCGHNFCLQCLQGHMVKLEQAAANPAAGRKSRACTQRKPCPKARCGKDLTDFMTSVRANNAMATQAAEMAAAVAAKEAEVARLQQQLEGGAAGPSAAIEAQPPVKVEDQEAEAQQAEEQQAGSDADTVGSDADEEMGEAAVADEEVQQQQQEEAEQEEEADVEEEARDAAAAGGGAAASPSTAAALSPEPQAEAAAQQPAVAGGAGAAAGEADGQGRYGHAAVGLAAKFPDFDVAVIEGMLEDQGGDVGEVAAFLRRMARDQAAAARSPKAAAARKPTAGGKRKRKSGGKSKAAKSRADEDEAGGEEEEQEEEEREVAAAAEEEEEAQGDEQEEQAGEEAMEVEMAVAVKGRKAAGAGKKRAARAEPSKRRRKAVAA